MTKPKHVPARRADKRDAEVGRAVRARRLEQCMSQTELGGMIGVTFQQVQKYEKGVNRIGAGRLQRLCEALHVPPSYFLGAPHTDDAGHKGDHADKSLLIALAQDNGAHRILAAYHKASRQKRQAMVANAEAMAA